MKTLEREEIAEGGIAFPSGDKRSKLFIHV